MESSSLCNKTDCVLTGLRKKPGNVAAKREYGEWKVTSSNLPYLNYKEREEEDIEEALRKFGDRSTIKFWDWHSMCLLNEECRCDGPEGEDSDKYDEEEEAYLVTTLYHKLSVSNYGQPDVTISRSLRWKNCFCKVEEVAACYAEADGAEVGKHIQATTGRPDLSQEPKFFFRRLPHSV